VRLQRIFGTDIRSGPLTIVDVLKPIFLLEHVPTWCTYKCVYDDYWWCIHIHKVTDTDITLPMSFTATAKIYMLALILLHRHGNVVIWQVTRITCMWVGRRLVGLSMRHQDTSVCLCACVCVCLPVCDKSLLICHCWTMHSCWRFGIVNKVTLRWARLILRWVTIFGWVYRLGMKQLDQLSLASLCGH